MSDLDTGHLDDLLDEARDLVLAIQLTTKGMDTIEGFAIGAVAGCALERLRDALEMMPTRTAD